MTNKPFTSVSSIAAAQKILAVLFAAIAITACASPKKVDRIHSSIYHQQASIQQLEDDMVQIEEERQQVAAELQRLETEGGARAEQIQQTRDQLLELDDQQNQIQQVMRQMDSKVTNNSRSISALESKEQKRRAIIRAQQERWQEITVQTDTKLAEVDQPQLNPGVESNEGDIDNAKP